MGKDERRDIKTKVSEPLGKIQIMSRKLVYQDADEEKVSLPRVESVESIGDFFHVEYKPVFSSKTKATNIRKDRVIRYDG